VPICFEHGPASPVERIGATESAASSNSSRMTRSRRIRLRRLVPCPPSQVTSQSPSQKSSSVPSNGGSVSRSGLTPPRLPAAR
jgi:hypothetical protein